MYSALLHTHSVLRWVLLVAFIYTIYQSFIEKRKGSRFSDFKMSGTIAVATLHLQFILGLAIYFQSPWYQAFKEQGPELFQNSIARFYILEHPIMMLLAVIIATIGNARAKKVKNDDAAFRKRIVWLSTALLIVLIAIPWPFRFALAEWF